MQDYYAILKLDSGASAESIKVAYRSLARLYHPDRHADSSEAERHSHSIQMAQLNEAYATLSDSKRRREYDDMLRTVGILMSGTAPAPAKPEEKSHPAPHSSVTKTTGGSRARQHHDDDYAVVREFSKQIRSQFVSKKDGLSWAEIPLEGFDWGLEATAWSSHYCVAGRGFPVLDAAAAKKFVKYSDIVIAQNNRTIRKSHFLFVVTFQQVSEWDTVSNLLQGLVTGEKHAANSNHPTGIVLVDMRQSRTVRLGALPKEEPFNKILHTIGTSMA